jgi:hypothetical protein
MTKGKSKNSDDDDVQKLVSVVIEGALCHLKGNHNSVKAKLLMAAVVSGKTLQW